MMRRKMLVTLLSSNGPAFFSSSRASKKASRSQSQTGSPACRFSTPNCFTIPARRFNSRSSCTSSKSMAARYLSICLVFTIPLFILFRPKQKPRLLRVAAAGLPNSAFTLGLHFYLTHPRLAPAATRKAVAVIKGVSKSRYLHDKGIIRKIAHFRQQCCAGPFTRRLGSRQPFRASQRCQYSTTARTRAEAPPSMRTWSNTMRPSPHTRPKSKKQGCSVQRIGHPVGSHRFAANSSTGDMWQTSSASASGNPSCARIPILAPSVLLLGIEHKRQFS